MFVQSLRPNTECYYVSKRGVLTYFARPREHPAWCTSRKTPKRCCSQTRGECPPVLPLEQAWPAAWPGLGACRWCALPTAAWWFALPSTPAWKVNNQTLLKASLITTDLAFKKLRARIEWEWVWECLNNSLHRYDHTISHGKRFVSRQFSSHKDTWLYLWGNPCLAYIQHVPYIKVRSAGNRRLQGVVLQV